MPFRLEVLERPLLPEEDLLDDELLLVELREEELLFLVEDLVGEVVLVLVEDLLGETLRVFDLVRVFGLVRVFVLGRLVLFIVRLVVVLGLVSVRELDLTFEFVVLRGLYVVVFLELVEVLLAKRDLLEFEYIEPLLPVL